MPLAGRGPFCKLCCIGPRCSLGDQARGHLLASLDPCANRCGEGMGMEYIHGERKGRGGCQGAGPEGDRRVPPVGWEAPEVSLQQRPPPCLGCSSWWGWGAAHIFPHCPPRPCSPHVVGALLGPAPGFWGPHYVGCPLLQVVRSYKATIQQTLDILFLREGSEFLSSTDASSRDSADRTIIAWDFQSSAKISNQIFHVRNPIGHWFQVVPQGASV